MMLLTTTVWIFRQIGCVFTQHDESCGSSAVQRGKFKLFYLVGSLFQDNLAVAKAQIYVCDDINDEKINKEMKNQLMNADQILVKNEIFYLEPVIKTNKLNTPRL